MFEIFIIVLVPLLCYAISEAVNWYVSDDRKLPLSYWSREELDSAFARSPFDRKNFEERGTLSRNEWRELMMRRDREVVAELKRRGVNQESTLKK